MRTRVLWLVLAWLSVSPAIVLGEPTAQMRREAGVRFERGLKLYHAGDYPAALAEFEAAYAAVPRFEVLLNIGVTQKKLFRYGDAVRTLKKYLEQGGRGVATDRATLVQQELAEIRSLVAEVVVRVDGAPAEIAIDGEQVATTPLDAPILVRPGRHVVRASRAGEEPAEKTIQVVSGSHVDVELQPVKKSRTAQLTVTSHPSGAMIALDGKNVGKEPWIGTVDAGGHEVSAALTGYHKSRLEVVLTAGQERRLTLELAALPKPKPWYKRWYVWTPIVLVVAGGVTAAVVLTRPGPPDVQIDYPK